MMEQFDSMGVPAHFFTLWRHPRWGSRMQKHCSVGPLERIFIALYGSLWLGKDKGSIMKSAESGGLILTYSWSDTLD